MKKIYVILLALIIFPVNAQSYNEWKLSQQESYKNYKQSYLARYSAYKQEVTKKWGDYTKLSSPHDYILYKKDFDQRVVLDYENNQIILESLDGSGLDIHKALSQLANTSVGKALATDPVLPALNGNTETDSLLQSIAGVNDIGTLIKKASIKRETIATGGSNSKSVDQIKISLPAQMVVKRAEPFFPVATEMSQKFNIDRSLILAIAQTESSFNPLAQSPIPAFGLMQIVPDSAGKDVNVQLNNKSSSPNVDTLFQPDKNIRFGAGYLHILNSRYLKNIKDDRSRLYCTIAAYNTGAGNVASVFHPQNKRSLAGAVEEINQLSPDEVYQKLITKLPYQETRTYLKKVYKAQQQYKKLELVTKPI
ncbi:transglycosylase SLT domain-containing protein [Marinomonas flavescens]|uniref:transglycosylase SLT domain-containing protein n=1 Tax=Marinomonas flavescens TaxID=2529379 RepID=UPI001055E9E0|nr:transglycosylase SLT domain-containing protein [Marinomonas flavescens]